MFVLRIVCGFLSELVGEIYKCQGEWKEFLEFLAGSLALNIDKFQETALLVFANLPNDCRRTICEALFTRIDLLHLGLLRSLSSENVDVKVAAFGAVVSLMHLFSSSLDIDRSNDLTRAMMMEVFDLLKCKKEDCAQKGIQELIKLVMEEPQILKPYVNYLVLHMLKIAESGVLKDETKNCAIQFLMTMLEADDLAPAFQILPSESMAGLFSIPMRMLLAIKDEALMGSVQEDDAGKTDTYSYGLKCLNQISIVLGGKNILPIAFELLPIYMNALEWQRRQAGLTMLGVISKECSAEIILTEDYLEQVVNTILTSFHDSQPHVCWAAFHLMQLATDLIGAIQIIHHRRILPALVAALDKKQYPRVEEEVASAVLSFVKSISRDSLTIFIDLDNLLRKLLALLKDNNRSVRCTAIALHTFNVVATQLPGVCIKYSAHYLPILLEACTNMNSEVRKEATGGIRICAEFGGSQFRYFIESALVKLGGVIAYPNKSCIEDLKASDIAVCAIGKICEFHRDFVSAAKLAPTWLNFLPIKDDLTEAKDVHNQLCIMVERLDRELLGHNYEHLHKIVAVFLEVISQGSNLATPQTLMRMKELLKQIWLKFPQPLLNSIFLSLTAKHQDVLAAEVDFTS
ncbi:importin subunit beta-3 isoform X2 [Ricinus communis]|nr:importin subunit beta-3 isoform X2 [Ricinus communis]|eukprot:XP_025015612.1 importin subunit beta-3 isoform X2 [Ricinus communis]